MKVLITKTIKRTPVYSKLFQWKHLTIVLTVLGMLFMATSAYSQNIKVKGRVTSENGQPVARASVLIKGTTNGVTANDNGDFEITAPANGTLLISAVNFTSQEVRINNKQTVDVSLVSLAKTEAEVVVTGYGTTRKKDVTGSVATITGATLKEVPAPNFIAQLKGRTAGVDIVSNSATPGGGGQIRIRGNRSMTRSQGESDQLDAPLLVVDGVPLPPGSSINDINPDDITSIDILKDASATAIYGSRGAGGVILITSKRGRTGKMITSYDGYVGISNILGKLNVFNGAELAKFKTDAALYNRTNWPTSFNTTSYALTAPEQAALAAGVSTDWQDLIYQQGVVTSHNLGLSGGNEGTQYVFSGGYYKETGIIPHQNYERYSSRISLDHQINNRIKVGATLYNVLSYSNTPGGSGVTSGLVRTTPLASPYNPDGTVNLQPQFGSVDAAAISPLTLKTKASEILAKNRRLASSVNLYGEVKIIEGLRYRFNGNFSYVQNHGDGYSGPGTFVQNNTSQSASSASVNDQEGWTWNIQHLLYYTKTFAGKHRIDFTGLYEAQKDHSKSSSFGATGVPADYILNSNFALANSVTANNGSFSERGLVSVMGRLIYGYDNRYLLTVTVRNDGASVLAPGHQYYTYPAFAFGWNATNESFMKADWLSNLKVRGGWGKTSNQGVNPYTTLGLLSTGTAYTYNFGNNVANGQQGYLVTNLANNALKWQTTSQWNVGVDFGLFKNRLTGTIDVYKQKTKDILLPVSLPPSNGAASTTQNLGKTEGHGVEISLSSINVQTKSGITWSTDLSFYFNREKITQLQSSNLKSDIGNGWFIGQPLTVIYDVKKIGIWQLSDSTKGLIAQQISPVQYPGQIMIQDVNGDHKIDQNDRQIIGNFQPQWDAGMTNRVTYKNFDLSIVIYARMGMKVVVPYVTDDGGAQGFPFFMQSRNNQVKVDYWTRTNPTNAFPAPDAGTDRFPFGSTLGYMDGSFVKCRSINLGYQVPASAFKRSKINSLRVYVNLTNPFIIYSPFVKDGFGPDPEGNGYGGQVSTALAGSSVGGGGANGQGRVITVNANNPSTRQVIVGVNLKF